MLTISTRKGFRPLRASTSRNTGSWVRGVQAATTTRFSRCSSMAASMARWEMSAQAKLSSVA